MLTLCASGNPSQVLHSQTQLQDVTSIMCSSEVHAVGIHTSFIHSSSNTSVRQVQLSHIYCDMSVLWTAWTLLYHVSFREFEHFL